MAPRKPIGREGAKRMSERERAAGLDPDDAAARWLAEHDPAAPPAAPKAASKSRTLHRWRQEQQRRPR
ncbi:MAG: hypothetical protein ACM33B_00865 [Pseudomonadota bacterium]